MVMTDRQTQSVWTHLDGEATRGAMKGKRMKTTLLLHTTWDEWKKLYPNSVVLSNDTPFKTQYRQVSLGAPNPGAAKQFMTKDTRLAPEELLLGVRVDNSFVAYPLSALKQTPGVLNDTITNAPIVIFYDVKANAAVAYSRAIKGQTAQFEIVAGATFIARDSVTKTTWDFAGRGVAGELQGAELQFVTSYLSEWYGWSAYHPTTSIYGK